MSTPTIGTKAPTPRCIAGSVAPRHVHLRAVQSHRQPPYPTLAPRARLDETAPVADNEPTPPTGLREEVLREFGMKVARLANERSWSRGTRKRARGYIYSLVQGTAKVPRGLYDATFTRNEFGCLQDIRKLFAETCVQMGLPSWLLPGMDQYWYNRFAAPLKKLRKLQG